MTRSNRLRLASRVVLVLALGAANGCSGGAADAERTATACERLRDHVIDLRVAEVHQDRDAHRAALRRAMGRGFVSTCMDQSDAHIDCEMKATTIDALRACAAAD